VTRPAHNALVESSNGHGGGVGELPSELRWPAPAPVVELAEACVRFVERALKVRLDYQLETLPVVDHWIAQARAGAQPSGSPDAPVAAVVAHAAGAYFGEVVRRRHAAWWDAEGDDHGAWEVQLEGTYLSLRPIQIVELALRPAEYNDASSDDLVSELTLIELDEEDRLAVAARLAELPPVSEEEYRSLATLIEVIDIAVDAARGRRLAAEEPEPRLSRDDYRRDS
jgi:hypothetical protein